MSICLPASVKILEEGSFMLCNSLCSLTFESGSKLSRIEAKAFQGCSRLTSIVIPKSIEELRPRWALGSSLYRVIFESASSLQRMVEGGKADLSRRIDIQILDSDCALTFPGYSVEMVHAGDVVIRLVKISRNRK
jgi:hypothetical protein